MHEPKFEFGIISRGVYFALITVAGLIPFYFPGILGYYVLGLLFLGLGLRPVLERSGLHDLWERVEVSLVNKWNRKFLHKRRMEVDRKIHDAKYRGSRVKDSRLPRNW